MDGLEGKNRCELHIWPVSEKPKPEVLVRWQPEYGAAMFANVEGFGCRPIAERGGIGFRAPGVSVGIGFAHGFCCKRNQ